MNPPDVFTTPPKLCNKKGCRRKPAFTIGLWLWACGHVKKSIPMEVKIGVFLCKPHAEELTVDAILSPPLFERLDREARRMGKIPPDRKSAILKLWPIPKPKRGTFMSNGKGN